MLNQNDVTFFLLGLASGVLLALMIVSFLEVWFGGDDD